MREAFPEELPDRLYLEESKKDSFAKIKNNFSFDVKNKDIFFLALTWGYKNDSMRELDDKGFGVTMTSYLNDKDLAVMTSIAIKKKGIHVINKPKNIYEIAEKFANFGITIIENNIQEISHGSFGKELEDQIFDLYYKNYKSKSHV